MDVPFLDLSRLHAGIRDELDAAFDSVLSSSAFVGGSLVTDFERDFAAAHGVTQAAACGSGTDALSLSLRALGIGPGDEVIVPAMTFVATAEAVVHVGATPVLADVDPETLLLGGPEVERVRTPATKAVIPVHLYGHVVPLDLIASWREDGLLVVEDAAQAHLATWRGIGVGSKGNVGCFSFYPGKNLGALGDGGMVIGDDADVIADARRVRDHGRSTKYRHDDIGWCSRLDGLQAAFLGAKLRHLPAWTEGRQRAAARYNERLHGESGDVRLVPWEEGAVHHLLVVRVPSTSRDALGSALGARGVASGVHYPIALSGQPSLAPWATACPEAERAADEVLSLPMDPLMTDEEVDFVCDVLLDEVGPSARTS